LQPSTLAKRACLLLFFAIVAFYLYGLGKLPLVGPDEPRYAQVAREMFLRGDLITPTLGGHTWFEKPVLLYWMMMASFKVFGVSEWSARLGPALAGLLTIAAVWWISRRLELKTERHGRDARATWHPGFAFFCMLVIASSGGLIVFSRAASFDIVVTMTLTWAFSFFLASEIESRHRKRLLAGFYCFVGLSLLAKGLIGIVLPFGVITLFYLLRRRLPDRTTTLSLVWGFPLLVAVAAVWYGPVIARHGWGFIDEFFVQHHFARYFSNKYQHPQPIYFYLLVILMIALPWTVFLIESLIRARGWQARGADVKNKARMFALAWFLVPIVFFSFSGSKLPAYILPSLPGAALLVGERLSAFVFKKEESWLIARLTAVAFLLLGVAGIIFAQQTGKASPMCSLMVVAAPILAGTFILLQKRQGLVTPILIALVPAVGSMFALNCVVDHFASRESVRELIRSADARGYGAAHLIMFSRIERTAEFYGAGRVIYGTDGDPLKVEHPEEVLAQVKSANGPLLLVVPLGSMGRLESVQGLQINRIADNGRNGIVAASLR
jgi:4-amino-4-deoxy-L-arabinose transferase-like glycosyltransferase